MKCQCVSKTQEIIGYIIKLVSYFYAGAANETRYEISIVTNSDEKANTYIVGSEYMVDVY